MSRRTTPREHTPGLPVVMIVGPTAVGKTGLSLALGERYDIEIVNADSRYLYRGMDIGTAKPPPQDLARVPHHLVDVLDPDETYSLGRFLRDAYAAIEDIAVRGRLPVVVGGTPQYLKALLEGWAVPEVPPDDALRAEFDRLDSDELYRRVQRIDPESAERIGPANRRRLIRALEVFEKTGKPISALQGKAPPPYRWLLIGLRRERDELHRRVRERAEAMLDEGLLDEARQLLQFSDELPAMSAISYPEARALVRGEIDRETALERIAHANTRYIRHQETWFRKFPCVVWFDASASDLVEQVGEKLEEFLGKDDGKSTA